MHHCTSILSGSVKHVTTIWLQRRSSSKACGDRAPTYSSGRCPAWSSGRCPAWSSSRCPAWSSEALPDMVIGGAARHGHRRRCSDMIFFVLLFLLWYGIVEGPVNIQRGGGACEHSKRRWSMEGRKPQPLWCLEYLL